MGRPVHRTPDVLRPRQSRRPAGSARRVRLVLRDLEERTTPATFTVTNADDAGTGSLRDAITQANGATTADTIVFDTAGVFATAQTISLLSALPQITSAGGALTISGTGAANLTVRRDPGAGTNFRILDSVAPALTLTGFTVSGGRSTADGGGLQASGTITLDGMVFTDNQVSNSNDGGAIRVNSGGFLALLNSTVSGNSAATDGGGIYFFSGGSLLMENSTISGNSAGGTVGGGGIYFFGAPSATPPAGFTPNAFVIRNSAIANNTASAAAGGGVVWTSGAAAGNLIVQNSTITGNTASTTGGGIGMTTSAGGALRVENSTITGNTANGTGGGGLARLSTTANTLTVANSVVSGNSNATAPDIVTGASGTTVNVNYSLVGNNSGFTLSGTSGNNLGYGTDPQLGALANNGGPTPTMLPAAGSPLVGAGSNALAPVGLPTDQRGFGYVRAFGAAVDIGAVEVQPPGLPVAISSPATVTVAGSTGHTFTVLFADPTGTNNGIDTTSLVGNNAAIRVTGPNGYDAPATYVSIDNPANGTPRTVTYSITAPGGSWDGAENGTYSVNVQAGQVADADGNFVGAGSVGTFSVIVPLTLVVTNADDAGAGSLRDALTQTIASPTADTILFSPTFFNTPRTISLQTALPQITAAGGGLTVTGPGAARLTVRRDPGAGTAFRVFDSLAPTLTFTDFTVSGGSVAADGGGLQASGTVTLDGMVFSGNQATGTNDGGAIRVNSGGFLTVRNSTLSGNSAGNNGGAIYFFSGGSLLMENSTVSGNTTSGTGGDYGGGGIYFFGTASTTPPAGFTPGAIVVRNSTIVNNTSGSSGGGILVEVFTGTLLVQNSTITGNTANNTTANQGGGGIFRSGTSGTITVVNSVVSGNNNANGPDILSGGTVNVNYSAVGSNTGFTLTGGNNLGFGTDLKLGALAGNGGVTQTMLPAANSPLLNAGSNADVPAGLTTDQRGTGFDRLFGTAVDIGAVEVQPPHVTINQAAGQLDPTIIPSVSFTVRFTVPVTGFTAAGVSLAGSTAPGTLVAQVTGSGTDYTVTVTGMTAVGTVVASVRPGAATDALGVPNTASTSTDNVVVYDPQAPTVSVSRAAGQGSPTNTGPIAFTVTFSEPVTGFSEADVSFAGSTVGGTLAAAVSGTGPVYTVTVTGMTGVGTVVVSIPPGAVLDVAGNPNSASTGTDNVVTFDSVGPTVTINQAAGQPDPGAGTISFDVLFDEPVTGFTAADVDLSGSTIGGTLMAQVTGSGASYTVTVTGMAGLGVVTATVPAGGATDLAGNPSDAATSTDNSVTFDPVAPTVTINRAAGQADPGGPGPVVFDVVFSEPVTGFTGADVVFTGSTVGGTPVAAVTGSATTYTVTVTGMFGNGTLVASIPAGGAFDAAGNVNEASTSTDNAVDYQDFPGQLEFASATFTASEVGGTVTVTVNRVGGGGGAVTVDYATAGGTATAGADYQAATGTLSWANGQAGPKTFVIALLDDTLFEGPETIGLALSNPTGGAALGAQATAFIQLADHEEGRLEFESSVVNVDEGAGFATITVVRTGGTDGPVSVQFSTADGTARSTGATVDYTAVTDTKGWADGEGGARTFTVPILEDILNEGRETVLLNLTNATGGAIAGPAATLAIRPSDPRFNPLFLDQDGDIANVKLTGPGQLGFYLTDPDGDHRGPLELIEVSGTDPLRSTVTITVQKGLLSTDGGKITLAGVTGSGLKAIVAPKLNLDPDVLDPAEPAGIHLTGPLGALTIGDVLDGADIVAAGTPTQRTRIKAGVIGDGTTIQLGSGLANLTATRVGDGDIIAPSVGTILVKGNPKAAIPGSFASDLSVSGAGLLAGRPALTALSAAGAVLGSDISVAGRIGTLRAAGLTGTLTADSIGVLNIRGDLTGDVTVTGTGVAAGKPALGTVTVTGAIAGAGISVGGNVTAVTAAAFRDSHLFAGYDGNGNFNVPATVGTFKVTGATDAFQNGYVFASTVKAVTLKSVDETNVDKFGFYAHGIGSLNVTGRVPPFAYVPTDPTPQGFGDFEVKIV